MMEYWRRLRRMARAQTEIGRVLEARLGQKERVMGADMLISAELNRLAVHFAETDPAAVPPLLRSLALTELRLRQSAAEAEELRRALLSAKRREKMLLEKQSEFREVAVRKLDQEQTLEAALTMASKVSRKHGVLR